MKKMKKWIVMLLMASIHIGASAADTSDVRSVTQISSDCSKGIALEGCLGAPAPRPCPSGYHWSLAGSGIAHCVMDDPVCPPDEDLIHDAQGNPSCVSKPKCANGGNDFPICTKPTCSNGGNDYPTCTDPVTPTCPNGATDFPVCTQPVCQNGASDYPNCTNPVKPTCANGGTDYPVCTQPVCANGASDYPTCTDPTPKCTNGASDYPLCTQPVCPNGAADYPICTEPVNPKCLNGASDYPICTPLVCENGASDWPTCTPLKCANGATDFPTCTPPTNPTTPSCPNGATNWPACNDICDPDFEFHGTAVSGYMPPTGSQQTSRVIEGGVLVGCFGPEVGGKEGSFVVVNSCGWVWDGQGWGEYPEPPTSKNDPRLRPNGGTQGFVCRNGRWS